MQGSPTPGVSERGKGEWLDWIQEREDHHCIVAVLIILFIVVIIIFTVNITIIIIEKRWVGSDPGEGRRGTSDQEFVLGDFVNLETPDQGQ